MNDNRIKLQQRKITIKNSSPDATLIYAENKAKDDYNTSKLSKLNYSDTALKAIYVFPETMPLNLQTSLPSKLIAGLLLCLKLKKGAHVMIATNTELNDSLINGHFGTVYDFSFINSSVTKMYLKLDDENAGKKQCWKIHMH